MKDIIFPITYKTDTKGLKDAESGLDKLGAFAKTAGIAIAAGLAVAGAAAVAFGAESLKAAAEAEAITRGLENAAKNAGVFGDSSLSIGKATEALDKHSKKLGELTGIDDELINQLKTGWLAVPDLAAKGTDGINKLAEAAADIAKGTGKDITAVAMAFTKISGDSETALSKLNRIGIVLSDQQKATYDDILATNGEIAAQDYLLQQLGDKYAGAATAAANPFERLDVIFGNLKETIGGALLPAFEAIIPFIQSFIEELVASPDFNLFLEGMSGFFADMIDTLPTVIENLKNFGNDVLPVLKEVLPFVTESLGFMVDFLLGVENSKAGDTTKTFAESMDDLANSFKNVTGFIRDLRGAWDGLPEPIKWAIGQLSKALNPFSGLDVFFQDKKTSYAPATGRGLKLAAGGIIPAMPGGTPATIGEAGPEAVIPLDRLDRMLRGGGSGSSITINVNAGMGADGAAIGEQIVTAIRKYERTSGKVFAAA